MQTIPKVGQYLYATCAGEDYGKIIAIGKDSNGVDCIDIEVNDPQNLIIPFEDNNVPNAEGFGHYSLAVLELPEGVKPILRSVQYRSTNLDWAFGIECHTPGDGCYRCTKSFIVKDEPSQR